MKSNLGTFIGVYAKTGEWLWGPFTAEEVIAWDHYKDGIVEFYPSGNRPEVRHLLGFFGHASARVLTSLDKVLQGLGGDTLHNFLLIHYVVNGLEYDLESTPLKDFILLTSELDVRADPKAPIRAQFYAMALENEHEFTDEEPPFEQAENSHLTDSDIAQIESLVDPSQGEFPDTKNAIKDK